MSRLLQGDGDVGGTGAVLGLRASIGNQTTGELLRRLSVEPERSPEPVAPMAAEGGALDAGTETQIRRSRSGGRPLDDTTRGRLEPTLGADLGHVRLHRGPEASDMATSMAARAFTTGSDVFLGEAAGRATGRERDAVLAHEVAHTLQDDSAGTVRRLAMTPDEVLAAVSKISFVKQKLGASLKLEKSSQPETKPKKGTTPATTRDDGAAAMRDHVTAVIQQYQSELSGADDLRDQAMALTLVVDAVAQVLAVNVLNDPALAPKVASEFLVVYGPELRTKLKKADDLEKTIDLTRVLVSDDPLRLYLHDELRIDYAARRIRSMAFAANVDPKEMLSMLRGRFEVDMAARSKTAVDKQEDKKGAYKIARATGEITAAWFKDLFGDVEQAGWVDAGGGGRELDFSAGAKKRLQDLEQEVAKGGAVATPTDRPGLTWKQREHLDEVEGADKQRNAALVGTKDIDTLVSEAIVALLPSVSGGDAIRMVAKVRAGLSSLPLTISVQGERWFGSMMKRNDATKAKTKEDFDYKAGSSRQQETTHKDLFGKKKAEGKMKHFGEWKQGPHDKQDRTGNYNRFRGWKDQIMTGSRGMTDDELPAFAAMNPNWAAYGTETPVSDPDYTFAQGEHGVNSYGDVHFVLKPKNVAGRVIYTATDHGEPHTDPFLAFADFLLADAAASRTKLKDVKSVNKLALHVLNAVILGNQAEIVSLSNQAFEVQIFGGINMVDDTQTVFHASSVSPTVVANLKAFNTAFGVPVQAIATPLAVVVKSESTVFGKHKKAFAQSLVAAL